HEPRAGAGSAARCPQRPLQPRRHVLRDAQWRQALLGQQRGGGHPAARAWGASAAAARMPRPRTAARGPDVAGALRALCRCSDGTACAADGGSQSAAGGRAAGRRGGAGMTDMMPHLLPPTVQLELESLRDQRDLYRSLLLAEPAMLASFMTHALETVERIRVSLRTPTRDQAGFHAKIERLLDELTALGEALLGLHLPTISTRLANALAALREVEARLAATGNDLLPAMVVLEELCSHLTVAADCAAVHVALEIHEPASLELESSQRRRQAKLATALEQLAERFATEHDKRVGLVTMGLEEIPEEWTGTLFDLLGQLVRNAIEHGIEPAATRTARTKPAIGTLVIEFIDGGAQGFELNV